MSGRLLLCWRHKLTYSVMRKRYLRSQEVQRSLHGEIANLFFNEFSRKESDSDDENAEDNDRSESKRITNGLLLFYLHFVSLLRKNVLLLIDIICDESNLFLQR